MLKHLFILSFFLLASCAVKRPEGKTEAEVLYKEAQRLVKSERFIMALEKLNKIKSQYPYSYYATSAELLQADILYKQENYEESAAAYLLFKDFHPKHPKMDYVTFKVAESYYKQRPSTHDRDLTPAKKAIKYFNELRSLYPRSQYIGDAKTKIEECYKMLKDKELYIANFYFRSKNYESAAFRYTDLIDRFNDKDVKKLAGERLVTIGNKINRPDLCQKIFKEYKYLYKDSELLKIAKNIEKCLK